MIILLIATGVVPTILTGGIQFRRLGTVFREVLGRHRSQGAGTVTPFQAVATALTSTLRTGNIAGVATAIVLGGPGGAPLALRLRATGKGSGRTGAANPSRQIDMCPGGCPVRLGTRSTHRQPDDPPRDAPE